PPEGRVRLLPRGLLSALRPRGPRPLLGLDVGCNSGELSVALYRHLVDVPEGESRPDPGASRDSLQLLCCDIDAELIRRARQSCPFPDSISFVSLDIMDPQARGPLLESHLERFGRSAFDVGFCMSVTMWIHLRHGDRGLLEFLEFLASRCAFLLLEPQPWKCYRAAARRLRKLGRKDFEHFRSLSIRGDVAGGISRILTRECAMELVCSFGNTAWDR
ncbi:BN3D2 methyltransferase, partial [Grallaria varia]|nr:BN3D2 methyltransferase [Grallaria varia]